MLRTRSKAAIWAVGASSAPMPPNSQIRPPTSADAAYSILDGAAETRCHLAFTVTGAAAARPDRSSTSDRVVGPTCPGSVAPPTA